MKERERAVEDRYEREREEERVRGGGLVSVHLAGKLVSDPGSLCLSVRVCALSLSVCAHQ